MEVKNLQLQAGQTMKWQFTPAATLELGGSLMSTPVNWSGTNTWGFAPPATRDFNSSTVTGLAANTRQITVNGRMYGCWADQYNDSEGEWRGTYWHYIYGRAILYYYTNSTWKTVSGPYYWLRHDSASSFALATPTENADITQFYVMYDYSYNSGVEPYQYTAASNQGWPERYWAQLCVDNYTSNLSGASVLASGTVNWWAIGE